MVSIVFFGLVVYLLWQARGGDAVAWLAAAVGVVAICAIGVSRIYLNAHWLSDVVAGAFLFFMRQSDELAPEPRETRIELPDAFKE